MFYSFLESKGAEYKKFEIGRFDKIFKKLTCYFTSKPKTIQIIGTNGKGSTAYFIANLIDKAGFTVGLYTSPHLMKFNERIVLNGLCISDEELEHEHSNLQKLLSYEDIESLSFFEYTTILAYSFLHDKCDFLVLEAGLGGEFDATTSIEKDLLLVSEIDMDHQDFLGNTIEEIATTKLRAMNGDTILGSKKYEVLKIANLLSSANGCQVWLINQILDKSELLLCELCARNNRFPSFLIHNLSLALAGFKKLGFRPELDLMPTSRPKGRFERVLPNVTVDVGHNVACSNAIKSELGDKNVYLIYNSMKDKDYQQSLLLLKPNIIELLILPIENDRVVDRYELEEFLVKNDIKYTNFTSIDVDKEYLVFGSFLVVQKFLNDCLL